MSMDDLKAGTALNRPRNTEPLPTTSAGWLKDRKVKVEMTLNDHVDAIHLTLIDHPDLGDVYNALLDPVDDVETTEGSLSYENFKAAGLIRSFAKGRDDGDDSDIKEGDRPLNSYVAQRRLASIVKALNVVLNRYGKSRKERARKLGGVVQPTEENGV